MKKNFEDIKQLCRYSFMEVPKQPTNFERSYNKSKVSPPTAQTVDRFLIPLVSINCVAQNTIISD